MANLDDYYFMKETKYIIIRLIWGSIYMTFIFITITSIVSLSEQFLNNPTITTLESAYYPVNEVPFPAVAICNMNKISKQRSKMFAEEVAPTTDLTTGEISNVTQILGRLYNFDYHPSERVSIEKLHVLFERTGMDLMATMKRLMLPCENLLQECHWKGVKTDCSKLFQMRLTYDGYCCTFNYVKKTEHVYDGQTSEEQVVGSSGLNKGLTVVLNNDIDDYQYVPLLSAGVTVQVFTPTDYPDKFAGGLYEILAASGTENFIEIVPTTIRTVREVKKYPLKKRQCLFDEEKPTKFHGLYSQSDCNVDCRIASTMALCQCIPFMIPRSTVDTVCDLTNLACLHQYKNKWHSLYPEKDDYQLLQREQHDALRCSEVCYPKCDGTSYEVLVESAPISQKSDLNATDTVLHLFYSKRFSNLYKQDVVYYWFEILSNFGGTFGLVVGMSLISVMECVIFMTQRLFKLRLIQNEN